MSIPKDQHYIPRMLLKRFTDKEGNLYFYDKRHPDKGVRKRAPKNLFYERHLYTQVGRDGAQDVSAETEFLAGLENRSEPIVEKIVSTASKTEIPDLNSIERRNFAKFFYNLMVRVPEVRDGIMANTDQEVTSEIRMKPADQPRNADEIAMLRGGDEKQRLLRNASIQSMQKSFDNNPMFERLANGRIGITVIRRSSQMRSFIIGSSPVARLPLPSGFLLDYPNVEIWLPLDRKVAVALIFGNCDKLRILEPKQIQRLNESVFEQSSIVAGCSCRLIESIRKCAN